MPYAAPKSATVQLEVFRGSVGVDSSTVGSMQFFGFSQRSAKTRTDGTEFGSLPNVVEYLDAQGRPTIAGDVFERAVGVDANGDVIENGTWKYVGQVRDLAGRQAIVSQYVWAVPGRDVVPAPGAKMRNSLGLILWDAQAGSPVVRPASGEQDIDEFGQPKVDGQGQPVLVP